MGCKFTHFSIFLKYSQFSSVMISQKDSALKCLGVNGRPNCPGPDGLK